MERTVKVIANASKDRVKDGDGFLKVYVTAQREKGKANKQVIKLLARHFKVGKGNLEIIKGEKSGKKVIFIKDAGG